MVTVHTFVIFVSWAVDEDFRLNGNELMKLNVLLLNDRDEVLLPSENLVVLQQNVNAFAVRFALVSLHVSIVDQGANCSSAGSDLDIDLLESLLPCCCNFCDSSFERCFAACCTGVTDVGEVNEACFPIGNDFCCNFSSFPLSEGW